MGNPPDEFDPYEFDHKERVRFTEPYPDMPEELSVLVGDTGFVVNPYGKFCRATERFLVQFDENKTGRPGGERHWIPPGSLEPEGENGEH